MPNPWDDDLATTFEDEETRERVSEFLGDKVQPYVTKLEEDSKPARQAAQLWDDFVEHPDETFKAVAEQLYGDDAERIVAALDAEEEAEATETEVSDDDKDVLAQLSDEDREALEYARTRQREEKWEEAFSEVKEAYKEQGDIEEDLFYPFVASADGDLEKAAEAYFEFQSRFGPTEEATEEEAEAAAEGKKAPPTVKGDRSGPSSETRQPETLDDALDDFFAETRGAPATV